MTLKFDWKSAIAVLGAMFLLSWLAYAVFGLRSCGFLDVMCGLSNLSTISMATSFGVVGVALFVVLVVSLMFKKGRTIGGFFKHLLAQPILSGLALVFSLPLPPELSTGGLSIILGLLYFTAQGVAYFII